MGAQPSVEGEKPMRKIRPSKLLTACLPLLLSACAMTGPAHKVAVDYNRSFAHARDEVLLLNVLRASAREPLQFSTMGTVTGGVRTGSTISIPFTNIIAGGKDAISPTIGFTDRNPSVTVVPLSNKEFTSGMLQPISLGTLDYFLSQGWGRELILPLVIGGVVCTNGKVIINRGQNAEFTRKVMAAAHAAEDFSIDQTDPATFTLRMSPKDALGFLKDGVGKGRSITSIEELKSGEARIAVEQGSRAQVTGLVIPGLCPALAAGEVNKGSQIEGQSLISAASNSGNHSAFVLRSIASIIYFLGEIHKANMDEGLGRCGEVPGRSTASSAQARLFHLWVDCTGGAQRHNSVVDTSFRGRRYYIPAQTYDPHTRTLDTLSLLSELIALQTSETVIEGASPIIAVAQ